VRNLTVTIFLRIYLFSLCFVAQVFLFNISHPREADVIGEGSHTALGGLKQWLSDTYIMYMHAHVGGERILHDWLLEFVHSAMGSTAWPVR
jgi:hypothetical protein